MKTHRIITLAIVLAFTPAAQSQLIDTAKPQSTAARLAADSIIESINAEITHRVSVHKVAWETLWENTREGATPDSVLAEFGTKARLVFAFSKANLEHIKACAEIVGKQPTDFLPAKYWSSPRTLVFHADGTVTQAPKSE